MARLADLPSDEPVAAVINLAGEPIAEGRWSVARKRRLEESRIALTQELVRWMTQAEPRPAALISASAIGFYGDQGDALVTEASAPHSEYTHELCAAWEEAAFAARAHGIRTAVLRIGRVLGPGAGFHAHAAAVSPRARRPVARPTVDELDPPRGPARMIDFLLVHAELDGVFNATAPNPPTSREFAQALGRVLRRPALLPAPALAFRAAFGEMSRLLLTEQRVLPARALERFRFRFPELEPALRDVLEHRRFEHSFEKASPVSRYSFER